MAKRFYIAAGLILLGISAVYMVKSYFKITKAREDASHDIDYYLQAELKDCEYIGRYASIEEEGYKQLAANMYFGFYKLTFRVNNLSSERYTGRFDNILAIDNGPDDTVRCTIFPKENIEDGIYRTASPEIPGKTYVDIVCYAEVREGTALIYADYEAEWGWDEGKTTLEIPLH